MAAAIQIKRSSEISLRSEEKKLRFGKTLKDVKSLPSKIKISSRQKCKENDAATSLGNSQQTYGMSPEDVQTLVSMEGEWYQRNNIARGSKLFPDNVFKMLQAIKTRKAKVTKQNSDATVSSPALPAYNRYRQETFARPVFVEPGLKIDTKGTFLSSKFGRNSQLMRQLGSRLSCLAAKIKPRRGTTVTPSQQRAASPALVPYHRYKQEMFVPRIIERDGFRIDTIGSFLNVHCGMADISCVLGKPIVLPREFGF